MKYMFTVLILLICAVLFTNFHFKNSKANVPPINKVIPYKIDGWEGFDTKADRSVYDILDKNELLLRIYKNLKSGEIVSLAVVLTNKRDHIHDPEVCYRGQGISMNKETFINITPENKAINVYAKKQKAPYRIIYWYTDLNQTYTSRSRFMKDITISRFFDKPVRGYALITVMGPESNIGNIDFAANVNDLMGDINKK